MVDVIKSVHAALQNTCHASVHVKSYSHVLPNVSTCSEPVSLIGADPSHADSVTLSCDNSKGGTLIMDYVLDGRAEQKR